MTLSFISLNKNFAQNYWANWFVIIFIISSLFLLTIDAGTVLHSDEFLDIDLGKNILNPETTWSIAWLVELQQPAFLFSYLGVVIQEFIYEIIGQYGPRIFALLGAIAAATSLVGYLIARGTIRKMALLLGLVLFLDPLIVQAFTIGRIDGWAMFFCLSSCWVLRDLNNHSPRRVDFRLQLLIAGSLVSLAIFTWPSAIFLFPLIILELYRLTLKSWKENRKLKFPINILLVFIIGVFISTIVLLLPISDRIFSQLSLVKETIIINSHSGSSGGSLIRKGLENSIELLRVLKFSPFTVLLAIIAIFKSKQTIFFFTIISVLLLMVFTVVYINRVQYLIPYFIIAISEMFHSNYSKRMNKLLRNGGIGVLLFWSISLSLGARTFLAFDGQKERDRMLLTKAAISMIGEGDHKVYIPWEFYYAGRSLNWKMYKTYNVLNRPMNLESWKNVLTCVDKVIIRDYSKKYKQAIIDEGLVDKGIFHIYEEPPKPFNGITDNEVRIRNLYFIFRKPYGPYRLYAREIKK